MSSLWLIIAEHLRLPLIIKVEDRLFKVPRQLLTRESPVFEGMFSMESEAEGKDDDHPIVLEGYESRDFSSLLKLLLPR